MAKTPKRLGSQIANPKIVTFADGPLIDEIFEVRNVRICDLRNLFAVGPAIAKATKILG
jgi:hypothetical protein